MRYAFVRDHRRQFPVRLLCPAVGVSASGFYRWLREPVGRRQRRREALLARVRRVHQRSRGLYGSPRVHRALVDEGDAPCRNTVATVMRESGLKGGGFRRKRIRTTFAGAAAATDLLGRDFSAQGPDRVWTADITYIKTGEGVLYLAGLMDLYSRRIVGWSMSGHMRQELVCAALKMALERRRPGPGLIHHSDRGGQYTSVQYRELLAVHKIRQSMSRGGDCYDNAPTESLWSTLKRELVKQRSFARRQEARDAVFEYIEVFYNRRRLHSAIGYKSPEQFEAAPGA